MSDAYAEARDRKTPGKTAGKIHVAGVVECGRGITWKTITRANLRWPRPDPKLVRGWR